VKKVSVLIPCYNEEKNVLPMSEELVSLFETKLTAYDYEIIFIDNDSSDATRDLLRSICKGNKKIKAIFNAKNFGQFNSPYYGILQTTGDCTISMVCDFQDPIELIPQYLEAWEEGYKIVIGVKTSSKENKLVYGLRKFYYKAIKKMSDVEQIENFTGSGLYDKSFVQVLRDIKDPKPFLRGIVGELGFKRKEIPYEQPLRRAGKTSNNFLTLYDAMMLSFTTYTKVAFRVATIGGVLSFMVSILGAIVYLIYRIINPDVFVSEAHPVIIAMMIIASIQVFCTGILGEYVININGRVMNRPLVIEEERINFED